MNETQVCVTEAVSNSATPDKNVLSKRGGTLGSLKQESYELIQRQPRTYTESYIHCHILP